MHVLNFRGAVCFVVGFFICSAVPAFSSEDSRDEAARTFEDSMPPGNSVGPGDVSPLFAFPFSGSRGIPSPLAAGGSLFGDNDGMLVFLTFFPPTNLLGVHYIELMARRDLSAGTFFADGFANIPITCCVLPLSYGSLIGIGLASIYLYSAGDPNALTVLCVGLGAIYLFNIVATLMLR